MFFVVVPLPLQVEDTSYNFHVYHISINGSDTGDCGGSVDSACFSFLQVLRLYYAEPPTAGLEIRTGKSLVIDSKVMVCNCFCHFFHMGCDS